ncbi:MAG TPA: BT_3928 family protein [Bacteroidia bacterium]|jgi:uncharacterized membrane protein YphA (DoxX/SURF4 family)|nr:BT_3928 family protein [Bacteroidia bacterium]
MKVLLDNFSFSFFFSSLLGVVTLIIILLLIAGLVMVLMPSYREKGIKLYRYLLGIVFIYSGFVKADDPLGFSYKLTEYFEAFGPWWKWAISFSFALACIIPIIEMMLGVLILIGARKKLTLWLLFLLDLFFTFLTYYTAHYNKVLECGCFGDAIAMTPWVTFWKDVIILAIIGILALGHKHITSSFSSMLENGIIIIALAASIFFSWYCYNYLPVIDFRPYKVGTDIKRDMKGGVPDVLKYYYTLKNKKSGETKEFDKFPENYQNDWDYLSSRTEVIKKGVEAKIHDFNIVNLDGFNCTDSLLSDPNYSLFIISSSIADANQSAETEGKLNSLANDFIKNHMRVSCLTASGEDDINKFKEKNHAQYLFYNTDDTQLRTMIRSNPGIMMIKDGIVIAMWHYHSIPDYKTLNAQYFHK